MTEKKIATEEIAQETWASTGCPSCRRLQEKLISAGYVSPSYRTLAKWIARWPDPETGEKRKPNSAGRKTPQRKAQEGLDDAAPALTGDPRTKAEDVVDAFLQKALPPPDDEPKAEQPKEEAADEQKEQPKSDEEILAENLRALRDAITGTDEKLLTEASRRTYVASAVLQTVLTALAPKLVLANPEGIAKLHHAAAVTLGLAGAPIDRIGQLNEQKLKTIHGQATIIEPDNADPLKDSIDAFRRSSGTANAA